MTATQIAQIANLIRDIRFAATYADRAEAMEKLTALVGQKQAIWLVYNA
jgi:hypothetical protein